MGATSTLYGIEKYTTTEVRHSSVACCLPISISLCAREEEIIDGKTIVSYCIPVIQERPSHVIQT